MRNSGGGYTIIEAMIVLAVSGAILFTAILTVSGKQNEVRFNTAVREVEAQLNNWSNDVQDGFPGDNAQNFNCKLTGSPTARATITTIGSPKEADCIFIGKAIQFVDKNTNPDTSKFIYAYSVFGSRVNSVSNLPVKDLLQASPIAAVGGGNPSTPPGSVDMTETYLLPGALRVKSVSSTSSPTLINNSSMIGLFLNFNEEGASDSSGASQLRAYALDTNGSKPPYDASSILDCLKFVTCTNVLSTKLETMTVCLEDSVETSKTARISITSTSGIGISFRVEQAVC